MKQEKNSRLHRLLNDMRRQESGAHLAVGALLLMTVLYATTII